MSCLLRLFLGSRAGNFHARLELVALIVDERPVLDLPVVLDGHARQAAEGDDAIVLVRSCDAVFLAQLCPLSPAQPAGPSMSAIHVSLQIFSPKLAIHAEVRGRGGTEGRKRKRTPNRNLSSIGGLRSSCTLG
jgi:hypothetical protein